MKNVFSYIYKFFRDATYCDRVWDQSVFKKGEYGKKPHQIIIAILLQIIPYSQYIYSKFISVNLQQQPFSLISTILKFKMIYQPYPNLIDSYFFMTLLNNSIYFNYDQYLNQIKTSSNIILVQNQSSVKDSLFSESILDKCPTTPTKTNISQTQSNSQRKKEKKQLKHKSIYNEVSMKKKKKISKTNKKVDMVQKQGRNSHSNILRKFFKLLSSQSEFLTIVKKIVKKYDFEIDAECYFEEMKRRNIDHRNYIRIKEIEPLFSQSENPINIITRILFQYYLSNYYIEHLLSSKKTDSKSIIFHLKGKRTIRDEILSNGKAQGQSQPTNESESLQVIQQ